MRYKLLVAAAMVALTACGQQEEPAGATGAPANMESGVELENMDTSVRPGDDFFSYVNGRWLAETEIPADKGSYGGFSVLRDQAQQAVRAIIEEAASGKFPQGSDEQKVGDLYRSYMDMETRNAKGVMPLRPEFERIEAISDHDELAVYFAAANRRGYVGPIEIDQNEDFRDPQKYMIYAWQNGLGLPDREYYFSEDEVSADIRARYPSHIAAMFDLAGFDDGASAATEIVDLETRIAAAHITKEATQKWADNYNKVPLDQLDEIMPNFNWAGFVDEAGIADIDGLVLMMTPYFEELDAIVAETPIDTWKNYLRWLVLNTRATVLDDRLDDKNFEFYGKLLQGTEQQRAPWRRAVTTVNALLGEVVGKVYVKKHFPPEAKERMVELVDNLIRAYDLDKLSKFRANIGYPDVWRDYSAIEIRADDLPGNVERATVAEYERKIARQGGPVDETEWPMTPQTVNASYRPWKNDITFPAAILQPPFDGEGLMRNWWTDEDRAEFERRTTNLVDQFNAYAPFEDLAVNGEFTLGENIGDLGGISIGLLAYKMSLGGEEPPVIDGFTGIQRVFLGYGQIWRAKYRDEALRQRIMTDPHSPAKYRTNGAVRNVPEFYEAFNVIETDALYLAPGERVKIW